MASTTPIAYPRRSSIGGGGSGGSPLIASYGQLRSARTPNRATPTERFLSTTTTFAPPSPSPVRMATPPRTRPPVSASPIRWATAVDPDAPRLFTVLRPTSLLGAEGKPSTARRSFTFLTPPSTYSENSPQKSFEKERSDEWSVCSGALSSSYASSSFSGRVTRRHTLDDSCVAITNTHNTLPTARPVTPAQRRSTEPYAPVAPKSRPVTHLSAARALLRSYAEEWSDKSSHAPQYGEGGYLGASPGMLLNHRYTLLEKLGWGEFSTVWLARDAMANSSDTAYVAIKVARCSNTVSASTRYEVGLLKHLRSQFAGSKAVPRRRVAMTPLVDTFDHRGTHGVHSCVVLPTFGPNLLCVVETIKRRRRRLGVTDVQMIKYVVRNIAQALADLAAVDVLHTDLKPENVLVAFPHPKLVKSLVRSGRLSVEEAECLSACGDQRQAVVLADFGLSVLMEPESPVGSKPSFKVVERGRVINSGGTLIQTREYRAPEVIVGSDFECRTDVWSLGCMIFEFLTGDFLFDPKRKTRVERDMDIEHLAMMMQIHGPMSSATMARGNSGTPRFTSRYFSAEGTFLYADKYASYPRRTIEAEIAPFVGSHEAALAADLISACVRYNPSDRLHAAEVVNHRWLQGHGEP